MWQIGYAISLSHKYEINNIKIRIIEQAIKYTITVNMLPKMGGKGSNLYLTFSFELRYSMILPPRYRVPKINNNNAIICIINK